MGKSYRIKTDVGVDKNISFQLEQDFEFLEILSLQISQNDVYTRNCADYGVVIGRVVANGGFGVPNVKVSIFVPITETDALNEQIVSVYPYTQPNDRNTDGVRFNLLPSVPSYTKHAAVGTFPTRDEVLKDPTIVEVFDKYYKYTVKTNDSGDYMIFGVPLGQQTVVMDLDLSDIGEFSLTPQDLIRMGRATEAQVAGDRFLTSTNLESLPQIVSLTKTFEVNPFWGDPSLCQAEVNRVDFDLREEANINIEPTAVFMGSMFSSPDSYRIGAPSSRTNQPPSTLGRGCKPKDNTGAQCENITGPGQILAVRQTINQDSQGRPILEEYRMENSGNVIDNDGTWIVEIPMNLDYVTTSEDGTRIFSNDPKVGIPTKGKYRFKVKWQQAPTATQQVKRPYYLVPNVREYGWQVSTVDPIYNSNPLLFKDLKSSYYFGLDWSGYTDASTSSIENEKLYNAINCVDTFYELQYNKVFTVSSLIDQYKRGDGRSKFIGIKDIDDTTCASTTNPFPVNDAVKNFDTIYFLFSIIFQLFQLIFPPLLVIYHIIAFLWNNLAVVLLPIIIGFLGFLAYAFGIAAFIFPPPSLIFLGIAALCGSAAITLTVNFRRITSFKFGPFNLPMMTYPECVGCDCTPGETIAGDSIGGTSLLTPLANPALYYDGISEGYLRFAESEDDDNKGEISDGNVSVQSLCLSQAVGSRIYRKQTLGVYKSTESEMLRLPEAKNDKYFAYGTSLPMAQRVNQFNSRKKYFDGLNRISVSFDNPSNTTKQHFDNTLTILSQTQFSPGTLLTFVNPENSSDKNYKFSSNTQSETGISGTTLFTGPSTVTINYATSQTTDTTQTYTLSSGSTETNYNFPADIEYYQVVTAITVSDAFNLIAQPGCASCKQYVLKCDDSTVGQLFAYFSYTACDGSTQYVNLTNIYDTTSQDWVGETQTVCACALPGLDSGDGTVTFVGTPCQIQPTYNSFLKLLNSNVSVSYARKEGAKWDKYDTSYQPRQIFEGYENQYILILQRGVDPYSPLYQNKYGIGKILGFPNENDVTVTIKSRVNVPIQKLPSGGMSVQDHTIQADYFYSSKFFEPGNGFSAFTTSNVGYYSGLDSRTDWKNFENSGNRTLKSYGVDNYFDYPTNSGVVLTVTKQKNEFWNSQINDGKYDSNEDISGLDFYWLNTSGTGKKPSQVESEYVSVSLLPQFQQTPLTINNKYLNVMRTDRLPSSDFLEGTKWNGIVPVLQQNLGFTIYEITTQYQEDFTTIAYGTGADTVSPDISDLPGSLNVVETFSCSNMVSIDCYSGDGKTFGVKADCQNNDIVYSGCYRFMTKPLLGLPKDLKGFGEYGIRYRFFYALCRGVVSQTFTNNWINGTLYTPPVQIRSIYDGDNTLKKTIYCKEFVFFDSSSNNFYMRSSPYSPSSAKGFIGKRQTPSAGKLNEYNLLFPTTIMNLGPKSDIYSEISLDPTYKGFVMKDLNPTSYGDTSDILTFFVISRITNSLFMQLLSQSTSVTGVGGVFTNNNIINILFSREERRIDGDAAQLLSINSEEGVIKFSADAYESFGGVDDPVQLYGNLVSGPVMGIFFSSTTQDLQIKDHLTPGKLNFRATPASSAIQYTYGIKSQEVPFYQWELNPPRKLGIPYLFPRLVNPTIFGSEENTWATDSNDLFSRKYQSLDRTNLVSPSYFIGSNTLVDETRARGYIFMEDNNGVITPNDGVWPNKFLVGAPFQFYFGLKKGATALDKFKSKYLADE